MLVCLCFKAYPPSRHLRPYLVTLSFSYFFESGDADVILAKAQAIAKGIAMVSKALKEHVSWL